jgi:hypothetical protein
MALFSLVTGLHRSSDEGTQNWSCAAADCSAGLSSQPRKVRVHWVGQDIPARALLAVKIGSLSTPGGIVMRTPLFLSAWFAAAVAVAATLVLITIIGMVDGDRTRFGSPYGVRQERAMRLR